MALAVGAVLVTADVARSDPGSSVGSVAIVLVVGAAAVALPARWRWGVLTGVLILAGVNGLPGPNLATESAGLAGLDVQQAVVFLLMAALIADITVHRLWAIYGTTIGRVVVLCTLANLAWWLFTLLRTSTIPGINVSHSVSFVLSFPCLYLLVPLLTASFSRPGTRSAALVTVGLVGLVSTAFFFAGSISHSSFATFTHANLGMAGAAGSPNRLFADVHDLFTAVFPLSTAAAVLLPAGRWRRVAVVVALINLAAIVAGQTRAEYLGVVVGLVVASLAYLRGDAGRRALRRIATALAILAALVILALAGFPKTAPSRDIRSFGTRLGSTLGTVTSSNTSTSTLAVRGNEVTELKQRLGSHWLLGLGFISPRDQYDANLPFGTIRNSDVGISSVVMTMGVIGTVLYYLPLLAVALGLLLASRRRPDAGTWVRYGVLAGLISVLVSSFTLTEFFSPTGTVIVASLIGLGAAALLRSASPFGSPAAPHQRHRQPVSPPTTAPSEYVLSR